MNVIDKYRGWEVDLIREDVKKNTFPYAVCMINLEYDFNLGTLIRNANAFGAKEVFYVSNSRKWDRRSAVGTHNYTMLRHIPIDEFSLLADQYNFVAIENNVDSVPLGNFEWPENPLLIFGSENMGISQDIIDMCKATVEIPMFGSVRSLNVGTSSGIVMNDFVTKYNNIISQA